MATVYVRSKYLRVVHDEMKKHGYKPLELVVGRSIVDDVCYSYKNDHGYHDLLIVPVYLTDELQEQYQEYRRELGVIEEL